MAPPATSKTLTLTKFLGMNTQASRQSIKDGQFSWLEGVMPVGDGNLQTLPSKSSALVTMSGQTIAVVYPAVIGSISYAFAFTTTGALYSTPLSGAMTFTQIAPPGTFSASGIAADVWKNENLVIIDPVYGYFTATPTTYRKYKGSLAYGTVTYAGVNYTSAPTVAPTSGTATFSSAIGATYAITSAAGSGYAVNDVLTVVGGAATTPTTFVVSSVGSGGVITGFNISASGSYSVAPANPASVSGGHGSGATFNLNMGLISVTLVSPGVGYTTPPPLAVSGGGGTGATATAELSISVVGTAISVFDDRVWIANSRTIVFTAADSVDDANPADGAGSMILTDGQFRGDITSLFSAAGYMYVSGSSSVSIVSNVQVTGTPPITTMSVTPITSVIGTDMPLSVASYMRSVVMVSDYGVYGITGASTQKLSDDLDGVMRHVSFSQPISLVVGIIENQICVCMLALYAPPNAVAKCKIFIFMAGKWFVADAAGVIQIFSAVVGDTPIVLGTDGNSIYSMFGGASPLDIRIQTKLYDERAPMAMKETLRCGVEANNSLVSAQTLSLTIDTEYGSGSLPNLQVPYGYGLVYGDNAQFGKTIGLTITGTVTGMQILGMHMQYNMRAEWLNLIAQAGAACTAQGSSAIPGYAIPGCMLAGGIYP